MSKCSTILTSPFLLCMKQIKTYSPTNQRTIPYVPVHVRCFLRKFCAVGAPATHPPHKTPWLSPPDMQIYIPLRSANNNFPSNFIQFWQKMAFITMYTLHKSIYPTFLTNFPSACVTSMQDFIRSSPDSEHFNPYHPKINAIDSLRTTLRFRNSSLLVSHLTSSLNAQFHRL